jgi:hypothetical protein
VTVLTALKAQYLFAVIKILLVKSKRIITTARTSGCLSFIVYKIQMAHQGTDEPFFTK